jgi:hypothetical protein
VELDEFAAERVVRGGAAGVHAELAEDRGQMSLNRAAADHELRSNLRITQARSDEAQHLAFAPIRSAGVSTAMDLAMASRWWQST